MGRAGEGEGGGGPPDNKDLGGDGQLHFLKKRTGSLQCKGAIHPSNDSDKSSWRVRGASVPQEIL